MDQKRLFLAIAISVAILLGFQVLIAPHLPQPPERRRRRLPTRRPRPTQTPTGPAQAAPAAAGQTVPKEVPRLAIAAHRLRGSISLLGARLDDLVLTDYRETLATEFAERAAVGAALGAAAGTTSNTAGAPAPGEQVKLPDNDTVWAGSGGTLSAGHPVTLSWDNGAGLTFQIALSVDDDYMFAVQQSVKNATGAPVKLFPWARIRRDYTPVVAGYYILFEGLLGVVDGKLQESTYANTKSEGEKKNGIAYEATATGGWAGITDKYWLAALVPDQSIASTVKFQHITENGDHYQVDYITQEPQTIAANGDASLTVALCSPAPRSWVCSTAIRPRTIFLISTRRWTSAGSIF